MACACAAALAAAAAAAAFATCCCICCLLNVPYCPINDPSSLKRPLERNKTIRIYLKQCKVIFYITVYHHRFIYSSLPVGQKTIESQK